MRNPRSRPGESLEKNPNIREMAKRYEGRQLLLPQYLRKRCHRTYGFNYSGTQYSLYNSVYRRKNERSNHRYGVQYFDTTAGVSNNGVNTTAMRPYGVTGKVLDVKGKQSVSFMLGGQEFHHSFLVCPLQQTRQDP
jgi:hypothetical protein